MIIDDDVTFSLMLRTWLGKKGFGVDTAADIAAGRRLLAEGSYDLVLSDMRLPDGNGTDLLQWIAERGVTIPVIVMTGYAEIRNAVVSMKLGARDYVSKPVQPDELLRKIREALDAPHPETAMPASAAMAPAPAKPRRKGDRALDEGELNYIEGHSDASRKLYEYVRLVAPTNMSVLLEGASGTGKEHVARLIHLRSKRAGKPFVAVETVSGEVQGAIFIPFDGNITRCEGGVLYTGIGPHPVKDLALLAPKCIRVGYGLLVLRLVLIRVNQATFRNISGNRVFVNLAHGFFSPLNLLNICQTNVKSRGFDSFVC